MTMHLHAFIGVELVPCAWMSKREQFRFPQSRKNRIRKKWRKRPENWRTVPDGRVLQIGNRIMAHPVVLNRIAKQLVVR